MDQRLTYEQIIGDKLQQLPIPNMQDMIWGRIKAQLDIDLPTDDPDGGGGGNTPPSPFGRGPIGWGLSVVIVALITAFFIFKNKPANQQNNTSLPVTTKPIKEPLQQPTGPPPKENEIKKTDPSIPQATSTSVGTVDTTLQQDVSTALNRIVDSIHTDTPVSLGNEPAFVESTKIDSAPPKKTGRGMSGVKDDDYRIVPKKN